MSEAKKYKLLGPAGPYESAQKGALGGNSDLKIYGRLDCPSALRALPKGYADHRVFFLDEATAKQCNYRPCSTCLRAGYAVWKAAQSK